MSTNETGENLYLVRFDEQPYYVEAASMAGAVAIWRAAMRPRWGADWEPDDKPDEVVRIHTEAIIRDPEAVTASEAKLREEVDQLRVQLAAAVGETNRLQELAQAYHNVRAIVSEQQWIEQRRRERAAENGAAEKVPA